MGLYKLKFKKYQARAIELVKDKSKVTDLLTKTKTKLQSLIDQNEKLKDFTEQIGTLMRMIQAYYTGSYREFPWKSIVMFAGALLYFVTPFDIIPDFIPALGLTDDISIVLWVMNSFSEDIDRFREWESTSVVILDSE